MNVLIFGGMSPRHEQWVRDVADALSPHFKRVRYQDYQHWGDGSEMDLEYEIEQAVQLAAGFGEYIVVAKSIGTVLTALANAREVINPERCVFMGLPLKAIENDIPAVAGALPKLPPTVFLHNEADPLGSSEAVRAYVEAHAPLRYDFQTLPGNTHDYIDFNLIAQRATD